MHLNLAISPCPNDTFSFYHLLHSIDKSNAIHFSTELSDIEALNRDLLLGNIDVSKASFGIIPHIHEQYQILDSGAALGFGCGPLLISKHDIPLDEIRNFKIAIPGRNTTANRLLNLAFGSLENIEEMVFSEIEDAVLHGKADAGLIIHESRFTYESKGLKKLIDLGQWWEEKYRLPIPLGCIVIKRSLSNQIKIQVQQLIAESIRHGFASPESTMDFVKKHAQEMDVPVMLQHINLYVNQYSVSLGNEGREAVRSFLGKTDTALTEPLFI
jgi:1,4-dihydroxy-6-naphthoate synthase